MTTTTDEHQALRRERVATRPGLKGVVPSNAGSDERFTWLNDVACERMDIVDFFVPAGHAIAEKTLNVCRGCPVRESCLRHAYDVGIFNGYFGGLSPGQRRSMTVDEAVDFIESEQVKLTSRAE